MWISRMHLVKWPQAILNDCGGALARKRFQEFSVYAGFSC